MRELNPDVAQPPSDPEDTPHQHKADHYRRERQDSEQIAGAIHELPQTRRQ